MKLRTYLLFRGIGSLEQFFWISRNSILRNYVTFLVFHFFFPRRSSFLGFNFKFVFRNKRNTSFQTIEKLFARLPNRPT